MPTEGDDGWYFYCCEVKKAIKQHYIARGVPENKLEMMCQRWVRSKGWRKPHGQ